MLLFESNPLDSVNYFLQWSPSFFVLNRWDLSFGIGLAPKQLQCLRALVPPPLPLLLPLLLSPSNLFSMTFILRINQVCYWLHLYCIILKSEQSSMRTRLMRRCRAFSWWWNWLIQVFFFFLSPFSFWLCVALRWRRTGQITVWGGSVSRSPATSRHFGVLLGLHTADDHRAVVNENINYNKFSATRVAQAVPNICICSTCM